MKYDTMNVLSISYITWKISLITCEEGQHGLLNWIGSGGYAHEDMMDVFEIKFPNDDVFVIGRINAVEICRIGCKIK